MGERPLEKKINQRPARKLQLNFEKKDGQIIVRANPTIGTISEAHPDWVEALHAVIDQVNVHQNQAHAEFKYAERPVARFEKGFSSRERGLVERVIDAVHPRKS